MGARTIIRSPAAAGCAVLSPSKGLPARLPQAGFQSKCNAENGLDLRLEGASGPVKKDTTVKNIRLTDGDHNIDCRIDGFRAMGMKSEPVKKA